MDVLAQIRKPVEGEMEGYKALFEEALQHSNPLLDTALRHLAQRRGKMMRPLLVVLSAKACGEVNDSVLHAAVALELLHTASLVHDDVVDESDRRRGQRSVNALLDNKAAVLVGDFLLSKALEHAALTGSVEVVNLVAKLGQTLSDGELLQLSNLDNQDFAEETYYRIIRRKTASLFETCARVGALLSGASEEAVERMAAFGDAVGICFQLRDDIFDYDMAQDVGKPVGHDIREGKLTLPLLHCLQAPAAEAERHMALRARQGEATDEEIRHLLQFTLAGGGIDYARQQMHACCDRATQLLETVPGAGSSAQQLLSAIVPSLCLYARFVADRDA